MKSMRSRVAFDPIISSLYTQEDGILKRDDTVSLQLHVIFVNFILHVRIMIVIAEFQPVLIS